MQIPARCVQPRRRSRCDVPKHDLRELGRLPVRLRLQSDARPEGGRRRTLGTLDDFDLNLLSNRDIVLNQHCYGCTAGAGSSCGGANWLIMSRLRISVIVPVFQEAVRIGDLVRYLLLHGGEALVEVIVVDSGSTDCTAAYAAQAGARVLQSPERSRAAQMNAGAGAASGEILYFVHADTMPPATFATDISETLEAGFVMGCYRYQFDKPGILLIINAWFTRFPWLWCQGGDKTFFIRKSTFFDLGGYNGHFVIMEEYDFLRRPCRIIRSASFRSMPPYRPGNTRKTAGCGFRYLIFWFLVCSGWGCAGEVETIVRGIVELSFL
jgi:hypothetical protein